MSAAGSTSVRGGGDAASEEAVRVERRSGRDRRRTPRASDLPKGERVWGLPGWLVLVILLAVAAVPMLAGLGRTPLSDVGEVHLLEVTRQTWARSHALGASGEGWTVERFVPVVDGREALDEAPGSVWLTAAAWWPATWMGREIDDVGTGELVLRGRLLHVGMALLAVAAAFWAGYALGGLPVAGLAGLIVAGNPLLTLAGRTGNGDAIVLGWTVLAGAAALWAMRPMKPAAAGLGRQAMGWAICGGALGMSALCGGLDAALPAALPLCLLVLLCPRRPGNALGLAAAAALGLLVVLPWVAAVHAREPEAWRGWWETASLAAEAAAPAVDGIGGVWARVMERAGLIVGAWGVWGLVVGLALVWPFLPGAKAEAGGLAARGRTTSGRRKTKAGAAEAGGSAGTMPGPRRRLFVGWGWLVGVTAMVLLAPAGMTPGVLLATLPIGALAAAQALWSVNAATSQGRPVWAWRVAATATAVVVLVLSGAVPWVMAHLPELAASGWLDGAGGVFAGAMPGWFWLALAVVLVLVAGGAGALAWGDRPERAAAGWGLWTVMATTAVMLAVSQGPGLAMLRLDESEPVLDAEVEVSPPVELEARPEARFGGVRDA
ncbi:MAG: hypothetical protein AAGF84_03325 [Planctomycetota bacterium]